MPRPDITVYVDLDELQQLVSDLDAEVASQRKRKELDARVLGKMWTFYGHNRSPSQADVLSSTFRRARNLFRGV